MLHQGFKHSTPSVPKAFGIKPWNQLVYYVRQIVVFTQFFVKLLQTVQTVAQKNVKNFMSSLVFEPYLRIYCGREELIKKDRLAICQNVFEIDSAQKII